MFSSSSKNERRTLNHIVDRNGNPHAAYATEGLWVAKPPYPFSSPTQGNEVVPLTTGKAYFAELIAAIKAAKKSIYIAGWQVNWDAMLAPQVRLFDVLLEAAWQNKVKIYVMPWDDTNPIQTYDDETKAVLEHINKIVGKQLVHVVLANSLANDNSLIYSHHQKQVVIDEDIAFVGGIDLAYGRYDDERFDLHADAEGRFAMNRYNGCLTPVGTIRENEVIDPAHLVGLIDTQSRTAQLTKQTLLAGAYQAPTAAYLAYGTATYKTLDPKTQPRMPWQDVHVKVRGPAVADLTTNFVVRWNSVCAYERLPMPKPAASYSKPGTCAIQVLRSAPASMREAEYKALKGDKARFSPPAGAEEDIAKAMEILIDKAKDFIYIENQFFVSASGRVEAIPLEQSGPAKQVEGKGRKQWLSRTMFFGDSKTPPTNQICRLLADRIGKSIKDISNRPFHVYITLPVHSEGPLNDGPIMSQIHWTMQSLVFGSQSLLNRIRRYIKVRELIDAGDPNYEVPLLDADTRYLQVPIEKCYQYVTLLNLRNWAQLGDRYVTEQVYVHSKLMIVDDRYALIGSANINDRSLAGGRDSELAVLVLDNEVADADVRGDGKEKPARKFARTLRMSIWLKLFGFCAGTERAAGELAAAIEKPGNQKSWEAIQRVAKRNARLYEAAFPYIPRNWDPIAKDEPASIWPGWDSSQSTHASSMPFEEKFWSTPQHTKPAVNLTQVKGFITELPVEWTRGENNNVQFHTALIVHNGVPQQLKLHNEDAQQQAVVGHPKHENTG